MSKFISSVKIANNNSKIVSKSFFNKLNKGIRFILAIPIVIFNKIQKYSLYISFFICIPLYLRLMMDARGIDFGEIFGEIIDDKRHLLFMALSWACTWVLLRLIAKMLLFLFSNIDSYFMDSYDKNDYVIRESKKMNEDLDIIRKYGNYENYEDFEIQRYKTSSNYIER